MRCTRIIQTLGSGKGFQSECISFIGTRMLGMLYLHPGARLHDFLENYGAGGSPGYVLPGHAGIEAGREQP